MGRTLFTSLSSKKSKLNFHRLILLLVISGPTWGSLVGAIESTTPPLNVNVNAKEVGGDELGGSEGDASPRSTIMDYPTPVESKFTSNGQFVRSAPDKPSSAFHSSREASSPQSTNLPSVQTQSPLLPTAPASSPHSQPPNFIEHQPEEEDSSNLFVSLGPNHISRGKEELLDIPHPSTHFPQQEKPSNINLLRKLWSSTRSTKLNLTHEHQSLLRIESDKSNTSGSYTGSSSPSSPFSTGESDVQPSSTTAITTTTSKLEESNPLQPDLPSIPSSVTPQLTSLPTPSLKYDEIKSPLIPTTRSPSSTLSPTPESPTKVAPTFLTPLQDDLKYSGTKSQAYTSSTPPSPTFITTTPKSRRDDRFPRPFGRNDPMLYPEWLSSSGGVYPDESTNGTGEYYGEPEYENGMVGSSYEKDGGPGPSNNIPGEEEGPTGSRGGLRRIQFRKRFNVGFLGRVAVNETWENRLRMREQQVLRETEKAVGGGGGGGGRMSIETLSTEGPEAIITQNGLADVISRGRIDSVMYVYFGDKYNDYHKEEIAGRIIQAIGGVIAAVAQVLTVLGAAKCVRKSSTQSNQPPVHLHIGFALLISNLLLILAVHATEPADVCATVALILHYLHLVIGCWLFAHTLRTYFKLRQTADSPSLVYTDPDDRSREVKRSIWSRSICYCSAAWTAPLPFIIMSYVANPDGYETRHYCWMSIEKGMVVSFIVPVFLLIGWNTFLVVLSLRHLLAQRKLWADSSSAEMDEDSLDERKISSGIRASAMLLPLLAIMWFLGVVALENASSIFFQIAAASANIALSWLVLYFLGDEAWPEFLCPMSKRDRANSTCSIEDSCSDPASVQPGAHLSFDNEPLLAASSTAVPIPSTSSHNYHPQTLPEVTPSTSSSGGGKPGSPGGNKASGTNYAGPSRSGKRQFKSMKKPNWSTPGGNEIYELKLDSISTIYK